MDLSHLIPNNNQFFTGGLVLAVMGTIAASLRAPLVALGYRLVNMLFVSVEVINADSLYDDLMSWLAHLPASKKFRTLSATKKDLERSSSGTLYSVNQPNKDQCIEPIKFTASPGTHFVVFEGALLWITRLRLDSAQTSSVNYKEILQLKIFSFSRNRARQIVERAAALGRAEWSNKTSYYGLNEYSKWEPLSRREPRSPESVVLNSGQMQLLSDDITSFLESEEWYREMGIPYRRGYLLYGEPGNGKTSSVVALAGYIGCDVYILQLNTRDLTDGTLHHAVASIPDRSILLLEDVDAAVNAKDRHLSSEPTHSMVLQLGVTLSGLLNAIDGACSSEGRILFMTTNYRNKLDKALIRPGRVDVQVEFTNAVPEQAGRLFSRFFPIATEAQISAFGAKVEGGDISMACLQEHLMRHRADLEAAIQEPFVIYNEEQNDNTRDPSPPALIRPETGGGAPGWTAPGCCGSGMPGWGDHN